MRRKARTWKAWALVDASGAILGTDSHRMIPFTEAGVSLIPITITEVIKPFASPRGRATTRKPK